MTLSYTVLKNDVENILDGLEELIKKDHEYENINTLVEYVILTLECIYPKERSGSSYWRFPPFIKQIICEYIPDIYGKHYDMFTIRDNSEKVEELLKIPQYEQRTEKWYEYRNKTVGASEAAALFDLNP